ncbi:carbohydrate ABC transporter permease [Mesotoga sp.]|uniref:carbohydrate ABC transporter permease n=1 Tax=Mesotoga sp. TaxID=2053577 RepID=UPI001BD2E64F|nr:carbohydrate ABC transporter permease [Mesotoga sp.]
MRKHILRSVLLYMTIAIVIMIIVFPYYWMIKESIDRGSIFKFPPDLWPRKISLESYKSIIDERPLLQWFGNTLVVALLTTAITLAAALLSGYSLSRFRNRTNRAIGFIFLSTQMLPATLLVIPMFVIFRSLNMVDNLFSLVLANTAFALPMGLWMMKGFIDGIPREIDEAGRIDGCNRMQILVKLIIPLVAPGMVAVAVFAFILAWGDFFFARNLISSQSKWLVSVGLSSFVGEYSIQWDQMLSASVMFSLPPVLFYLFFEKYLVRGLTMGAVKE